MAILMIKQIPITFLSQMELLLNTKLNQEIYIATGKTSIEKKTEVHHQCQLFIIFILYLPSSGSLSGPSLFFAGKRCNILPWQIEPSNSVYALTACSGIRNVTVPNPFDWRLVGSMGKFSSVIGPEKKVCNYCTLFYFRLILKTRWIFGIL